MIITSYSNIDFIQGVIGYGNATEGITDWRLENTGAGVFNILNSSSIITPSGGTTEIGQIANSTDRYMIFKGGTSTFTVPAGGIVCDILLVGGGGGGGFGGSNGRGGGGGGAGQFLLKTNYSLNTGTYNIQVGNGGLGGTVSTENGGTGNNTSILTSTNAIIFESVGGGGGARGKTGTITNGLTGASGGGGCGDNTANTGTGGTAQIQYINNNTLYTGYNGASGGPAWNGGGGGGYTSSGFNATTTNGGDGGTGITNNITGIVNNYSAGGGGGAYNSGISTNTRGGYGGNITAGNGGNFPGANGGNATAGSGSGGGGGGPSAEGGASYNGGAGGSGIVIIRYSIANISIIDNGNVGIGTTPITSSSKLEIFGDINISGNYRLNNRDVINDTSNYMLTTSNALVSRIITEIGHGSNYVSRIATQLNTRVDDTSNYVAITKARLANNVSSQWTNTSIGVNFISTSSFPVITSTPVATTIGSTGDYIFHTFTYTTETAGAGTGQTQYTLTVPTGGVVCDILVVGGGGAGGSRIGGGGGAGALIYVTNQTLNAGQYLIEVGRGGTGISATGQNIGEAGKDSEIFFNTSQILYRAKGGGGGDGNALAANDGTSSLVSGGSSGGYGPNFNNGTYNYISYRVSPLSTNVITINAVTSTIAPNNTSVYGYSNGGGYIFDGRYMSGGGGGAGSVGQSINATTFTKSGDGGNAILISITGSSVAYAGGGGGGGGRLLATKFFDPGLGGSVNGIRVGGNGGYLKASTTLNGITYPAEGVAGDGVVNTGSGGGGSGSDDIAQGTTTYYKAGSGGSGIVIIRYLSSSRNVGIGTTNPTSKLHVYDDITYNTKLTIQNNYIDDITISPNTFGYTVAETLESSKYYRTLTFNYFPNFPEDPPTTSLLAWYRFNGDGLDYNPYSTKYNLINTGATYSSGTTADSFFQGRRYINLNTGGKYSTTLAMANRAFSIALWLRITSTSGAFFLTQGVFGTNTWLHIGSRGNNAYSLAFYANDLECGTGVSGNPTSYPGDVNTWVHLVYVVLPNFNRRIYRNGVLISTDSNTSAFSGSGNFTIGGNCFLSDLRIYNNGLSATEVATLYASYVNLVITDNYIVTFKKSTTLLVNNVSRTVNGTYLLSMGHINSSMVPASGQSGTPLASTALTSLPIKYEYSNTAYSLPALITVSGATSSIIGTTDRAISFTYTSDSSGLTGQTRYTFTPTEDLWCDILIVGGGGGGGQTCGGGGGGGGLIYLSNQYITVGNYNIIVGNGGGGGQNGYNSSFGENIAIGGGKGADFNGGSGSSGGSGGGGSSVVGSTSVAGNAGGTSQSGQGNVGGAGKNNGGGDAAGGGGGGAGAAGNSAFTTGRGANGGIGRNMSSVFGTSVGHTGWFAGGGGGGSGSDYSVAGTGGIGGGGNGSIWANTGANAFINTGGGGGGGSGFPSNGRTGGSGGSGFVIIRFRKNQTKSSSLELITLKQIATEIVVPGTTRGTIGTTDRTISFPYTSDNTGSGQTQYTFTTTEELDCDILIVAGGGGGGMNAGAGGGAGGLILIENITLSAKTYTVRVGNSGAGGTTGDVNTVASNGINSVFESYIAIGGGAGVNSGGANGNAGGSGGGAGNDGNGNRTGGAGTAGQGFKGGNGTMPGGLDRTGGGGGGAGGEGQASVSASRAGDGGVGRNMSSIFGTTVGQSGWFAGGGAGGVHYGTGGTGGTGGGGSENVEGTNGTGGGGGAARSGSGAGRRGGSGIVIIRYRCSTGNQGNQGYKIGNYNGDFKIISSSYSSSSTSLDIEYMRITRDGASIYNPTGSPSWSTVSDRRIKENIEKASYDMCYDSINKLELYRFSYIKELNNINKDLQQLGYIAQEVKDIFPKAVSTQEFHNENLSISDMLSIDITQINYSLYGAVKKLIEMYNNKKERLKKLKYLLNVPDSEVNNVVIDTSNVVIDTSNVVIDTSNVVIDTSNVVIDTSNVVIDTSNLLDTSNNQQ